jgi:hypothetical protein
LPFGASPTADELRDFAKLLWTLAKSIHQGGPDNQFVRTEAERIRHPLVAGWYKPLLEREDYEQQRVLDMGSRLLGDIASGTADSPRERLESLASDVDELSATIDPQPARVETPDKPQHNEPTGDSLLKEFSNAAATYSASGFRILAIPENPDGKFRLVRDAMEPEAGDIRGGEVVPLPLPDGSAKKYALPIVGIARDADTAIETFDQLSSKGGALLLRENPSMLVGDLSMKSVWTAAMFRFLWDVPAYVEHLPTHSRIHGPFAASIQLIHRLMGPLPTEDGPSKPSSFCWSGKLYPPSGRSGMRPTAFRLVSFLWPRSGRKASFEACSGEVFDHATEVTRSELKSARQWTNTFFETYGIPLRVSVDSHTETVSLVSKP